MSLFKIREFWSTCSEDDEYFDQNSMIVTKLNSDSDYVITGSQSGVLRVFKPMNKLKEDNNFRGYDPSDLLLEKIFDNPILQIGSGRMVSGSPNLQIVVLFPKTISIYFLTNKEGTTDHGVQYILKSVYEHKLKRLAYNFIIGPFGGTQNRDFICVQSLDGVLSFYEQESFVFNCSLPEFLLPGALAYVKKTDSFVTVSSNWQIESYRYKILSEFGQDVDENRNKNGEVKCEWKFNIGEAVLDISVIDDFINKECWIMILGERNLYSLNESGRIKFMKRLEYSPICFNTFVLDDKVISMVVSETNTLLIYQNTSLKWATHLQFLPITIKRAFLKTIKGAIILLSEEGRLECCYLGTDPSLFVAPPLTMREIDFEEAGQELNVLSKVIKNSYGNDVKVNAVAADRELSINVSVSPHLETCIFQTGLRSAINSQMCTVNIELLPQSLFDEIQLAVFVQRPLKVVPAIEFYHNLCEKTTFQCHVFLHDPYEVGTLMVDVAVSIISSTGVPRTICKTAMLPLKLILETCQAQRESEHKITLNLNCTPVSLASLFPEFVGENSVSQSSSAIGFVPVIGADENKIVTILLAKSSERYRLQSNSFASLNILIEQLIYRLKKYYSNKSNISVTYNSALPANELIFYISDHFNTRQKVNFLQNELTQLSTQFRIIQKRLLAKFKSKNPTTLTNMELLLDDTYTDIIKISDDLEEELVNLDRCQISLTCALRIVTNLINCMDIHNKELLELLLGTFGQVVADLDMQNWEDVFDSSLCYLLRTNLAKSDKDKLRAAQTSFDEVKDITKLEKHLMQVLERIPKKGNVPEDDELTQPQNEPVEETTDTELVPIGSQFGESSSRLLSARKSLLERRYRD